MKSHPEFQGPHRYVPICISRLQGCPNIDRLRNGCPLHSSCILSAVVEEHNLEHQKEYLMVYPLVSFGN